MKIIEGLKKCKDLSRKFDDLCEKIGKHSAYLDFETPVYADQPGQVSAWLQAGKDILAEILKIKVAIQKTNLAVNVDIELDSGVVSKTIAEWIHRRRELAGFEKKMHSRLTDRGLKEEAEIKTTSGDKQKVKLIRCYDPATRDKKIEEFISEPTTIDARLEVINAITDITGL